MAVFTELSTDQVARALEDFELGGFVSLEPISSGIENTNYFLDTTRGRWVLTVFERLLPEQLPFYLELAEHLKKHSCRVACPVRSRSGRLFEFICGKPFAIADRLEGQTIERMNELECASMGEVLARMHLAAASFSRSQPNLRGLPWWLETAPKVKPYLRADQRELLSDELEHQKKLQASEAYLALQTSACHCDLFRNNALIAGHGTDKACVSGVFDFYFAGTVPWLYDLAVTVNDWCIDPDTGLLEEPLVRAFMQSYNAVRRLQAAERALWRDMLRAGALRFWMSRLFDYYCPREASLLKPHDPQHFERILRDRRICALYWPEADETAR